MKSKKSRGIGDDLEKISKATGVEKVVKAIFGEDCGCDKRRDRLNKMFPHQEIKMMDAEQKKYFDEVIQKAYKSGQNLGKHHAEEFYALFENLTGQKAQKTNCASCNRKTYQKLLKIYEASCEV
jgi:hypothetical protein